jgi:hypothetical protein
MPKAAFREGRTLRTFHVVPGFDPGIHVFLSNLVRIDVDGRDKPGHDDVTTFVT